MEIVENLINKKHLNKHYLNFEEMVSDFKVMVEPYENLKEGIDYIFIEIDENRLSETHTCPNCGAENTKKYLHILCVANDQRNQACVNCYESLHEESIKRFWKQVGY